MAPDAVDSLKLRQMREKAEQLYSESLVLLREANAAEREYKAAELAFYREKEE